MIDLLAEGYERNSRVVNAQVGGLTHEDSLIQTPYRINCLNWTLGHLLDGRGRALELLGRERIVPAADTARYVRESDPVTADGPGVLRLDALVAALNESGAAIVRALRESGPEALAVESDRGDGTMVTLGSKIHFSYFHDTYHVGQTELLRQVAGTADKII